MPVRSAISSTGLIEALERHHGEPICLRGIDDFVRDNRS